MSRWLDAAQRALPPPTIPTKGDKTPLETVLPAPAPVLSGFVGFVGRGKAPEAQPDTSTRATIIAALRRGLKTPGSIATAAKLGATDTYQELDRMAQEGLVTMQPGGALGLTAAADLEANP